MLPKKNRVDKKSIDLIFKKGGFISSPNLTFKFILTRDSFSPHISFITPKSVVRLATRRNSLRRKGYLALKEHIKQFPSGLLGVFLFKKNEQDISKIEHEIKNILNKIN